MKIDPATTLLNKGQLAARLGVNRGYVTAMIRHGFAMPGGRATVSWALDWLRANADFPAYGSRRNASTAAPMSAGCKRR